MLQQTPPLGSSLPFHLAASSSSPTRPKDREPLSCVSRVRFLLRHSEGERLSYRQKYLAQGLCKGGDHERRNQSSNQARITSAPAPTVSRGIDGQEEEQTAGCHDAQPRATIASTPWDCSTMR